MTNPYAENKCPRASTAKYFTHSDSSARASSSSASNSLIFENSLSVRVGKDAITSHNLWVLSFRFLGSGSPISPWICLSSLSDTDFTTGCIRSIFPFFTRKFIGSANSFSSPELVVSLFASTAFITRACSVDLFVSFKISVAIVFDFTSSTNLGKQFK